MHKNKGRKTITLSQRLRRFNFALSFVFIGHITGTFISYSITNYNAMTSEFQAKDNLWQKILGIILKGYFVTVDRPGRNIFWSCINKRCGIRMSWVEWARETSVRNLRVRSFRSVKRCAHVSYGKAWISCIYILFLYIFVSHVSALLAALGSSLA